MEEQQNMPTVEQRFDILMMQRNMLCVGDNALALISDDNMEVIRRNLTEKENERIDSIIDRIDTDISDVNKNYLELKLIEMIVTYFSDCENASQVIRTLVDIGMQYIRRRYELQINKLKEIVKISNSDGNWNYNPGCHGMNNGLILALCIILDEDTTPPYRDSPKQWLCDLSVDEVVLKAQGDDDKEKGEE